MKESGEFSVVWRPHECWVAASAPLPGEEPNPPGVREAGFAIAEGQRSLNADGNALKRARDLAEETPGSLDRLPGDFGFICFHEDGTATVVRSAAGLAPFYIHRQEGLTATGTRLGYFVDFLPRDPAIDALANAVWLTGHGFFPNERTFLKGVRILPAGSFVVLTESTPASGPYWEPRPDKLPRPSDALSAEHAEHLRHLLLSNIKRDLDPDGANLLTLSGGVDSSALLALAAGELGIPVRHTVSLVPPPGKALDHERSFIDPLVERYSVERTWFIEHRPEERPELLRQAPPAVFHIAHPALCFLPTVLAEEPVKVMFGGEFGDHITGSVLRSPDWADETPLIRLLLGLHKLPSGWRDPFRWFKHRALGLVRKPVLPLPSALPELVLEDVRDEYREWYSSRRKKAGADSQPVRFLSQHLEMAGWLVMNWEATSQLGVRRSIPFLTREILELAFQIHPEEQVGPGEKKILRRALEGYVPERNLERTDPGRWGPGIPSQKVNWVWEPLNDLASPIVKPHLHPRPVGEIDSRMAAQLMSLHVFLRRVNDRSVGSA